MPIVPGQIWELLGDPSQCVRVVAVATKSAAYPDVLFEDTLTGTRATLTVPLFRGCYRHHNRNGHLHRPLGAGVPTAYWLLMKD